MALFKTLKALYNVSEGSPQPPPVCSIHLDDATAAIVPECPPHTSLLVERRPSDEANQCMEMIRRP